MDLGRYLSYIREPILVVDNLYQVQVVNRAFRMLFPSVRMGENIHIFPDAAEALRGPLAQENGRFRVEHAGRRYLAHVSIGTYVRLNRPIMKCLLLSDITETTRLIERTDGMNLKLRTSSEALRLQREEIERNKAMEEAVAAAHEVGIILRDLHDTLGHTLTVLNALHRLALRKRDDPQACRAELYEALDMTRISVAEIAAAGVGQENSITAFLHRFQASMRHAGLCVCLDIQGHETSAHRYQYIHLSRICQEAATNSIRHGHATELCVVLRLGPHSVSLTLSDNGNAPDECIRGNGLIGMEERVNDLFGDITIGRGENGGFRIEIEVPVIME